MLLIYAGVMLLSIIFLVFKVMDFQLWRSITLPYSLTTIYFISGIALVNYGINKPSQLFLMSVFGGMAVRMLFILFLVFVSVKFFDIKLWIYIFVLFVTYFFYLVTEIVYLNLLKTKQ
jgi:hypothetical protein